MAKKAKKAKKKAAPKRTPAEAMADWAKPDPLDVLRRVFKAMDLVHRYDEVWSVLGLNCDDPFIEDEHYEQDRAELEKLLRDVQALLPDLKIPMPPPPDSELYGDEDPS